MPAGYAVRYLGELPSSTGFEAANSGMSLPMYTSATAQQYGYAHPRPHMPPILPYQLTPGAVGTSQMDSRVSAVRDHPQTAQRQWKHMHRDDLVKPPYPPQHQIAKLMQQRISTNRSWARQTSSATLGQPAQPAPHSVGSLPRLMSTR